MKKRMALISIFVMALGWASAAGAFKGSITIALPDDPLTMDPHVTSSTIGWMIWQWPNDSLIKSETGTGKIVPWLAERWEKLGPTKYKFWLRRDAKFTDGTP
ncbi:MAG: hypothetical protein AABZ64_02025, partial [Nitrospinota bacterium]